MNLILSFVNLVEEPCAGNLLSSGAYFYDLPVECQIEDHMLNMDVRGFVDFLVSLRLIRVGIEQFRQYGETLH